MENELEAALAELSDDTLAALKSTKPTPLATLAWRRPAVVRHRLVDEVVKLRKQVLSHCDRIASQSNALSLAAEKKRSGPPPFGVYVASRASLPARVAMWRGLRESGWPIVSSWIDEAGPGETNDLAELWSRIDGEVRSSRGLVVYALESDFPLKGALVEVGIAIGAGVPVFAVFPGVVLDPETLRPAGSWLRHPGVRRCDDVLEALTAIVGDAPDNLPKDPAP